MTNADHRKTIKAYAESRDSAYRITREGSVHLYGKMPNTDVVGWWLFAHSVEEAIRVITGPTA